VTCRVQATFDKPPAYRLSCSPQGFYHIWLDGKDACECGRREWWEAERAATLREIVRARGRA